jgi:hypothetical protein
VLARAVEPSPVSPHLNQRQPAVYYTNKDRLSHIQNINSAFVYFISCSSSSIALPFVSLSVVVLFLSALIIISVLLAVATPGHRE